MPGGRRLFGRYLDDRWLDRAYTAKFWGVLPFVLKGLPDIELQRMREFAIRDIEAHNKAIDDAKLGVATPGRPKPGDVIDDGF